MTTELDVAIERYQRARRLVASQRTLKDRADEQTRQLIDLKFEIVKTFEKALDLESQALSAVIDILDAEAENSDIGTVRV